MPQEDKLYGWLLDLGRVEYQRTRAWQRGLVKMRKEGLARDTIIFVEHPPVITVGRNGHQENFENVDIEPVYVERGGDVTYHGPGQLVVYYIFNLARRGRDLHLFMDRVQQGIIEVLAEYGIKARQDSENTGVWVGKEKIASIGIAVKNWVTYHGSAINLNTNLDEFLQINPCGLESNVMTSAAKLLGKPVSMSEFGRHLIQKYQDIFGTIFEPIDLEVLADEIESQSGGNVI